MMRAEVGSYVSAAVEAMDIDKLVSIDATVIQQ